MDNQDSKNALPEALEERVRIFKVLKAKGLSLDEIRYVIEITIENRISKDW